MVRVLQLVDAAADYETERSLLALRTRLGEGFAADVKSIGCGGDFRNAVGAISTLRRGGSEYDIIHAWGSTALAAAAMGTATPIVFSPTTGMNRRAAGWLRAALHYRRIEVISPTATLRRILVERGVPFEQCHMIRPGVDFGIVRRRRDLEMRAALGFSEKDRVLLAVGESTRLAAHHQAVWACSILHVVDTKYRLVLWGRGPMAAATREFAERLENPGMVVVAEEKLGRRVEFEELLPAVDAALVSATGAVATLPICTAMAAGVPIVSTVTYTNSELIEDRHTALMVAKNSPRKLAQRVLDLEEESRLQWSICDTAKTEAYEYFSQSRFLNQYRALYARMAANEPVVIPQVLPGAGSRFHGRGG